MFPESLKCAGIATSVMLCMKNAPSTSVRGIGGFYCEPPFAIVIERVANDALGG